jgi:cobaltochelatase CobS
MSLVKQSERTVRKACRKCGSTDLYWTTDTNTGKFVLVDANAATRATSKGGNVSEEYAHKCSKGAPVVEFTEQPAEEAEPVVPEVEESKPEPVAPVSAPVVPDSAAAALQALLGALSPSVDRDTVRQLIREEIDATIFPTVTVVIREKSGEKSKIDGPTHQAFPEVLEWLSCGEHVLMVGPAGTGKSTIAKQCADALALEYGAISLNPQTPKSDLFGYKDANGTYHRTIFRERTEHGGLMNLDEFDNGHGGIMAGLNMALANGHVAFPDGMVTLHDDFRCVAGANTDGRGAKDGYVRQRLDYATLDRFTVVHVGYDEKLEADLVRATGVAKADGVKVLTAVRQARANVNAAGMDLVYSPRASVGMARGIVGGLSWERVVASRLRRGLTDQEWAKVGAGIKAA